MSLCRVSLCRMLWRHELPGTQHYIIQHNDTRHNDFIITLRSIFFPVITSAKMSLCRVFLCKMSRRHELSDTFQIDPRLEFILSTLRPSSENCQDWVSAFDQKKVPALSKLRPRLRLNFWVLWQLLIFESCQGWGLPLTWWNKVHT